MADDAGHRQGEPAGVVPTAWIRRERLTVALQLQALSPRGARHRVDRIVGLRRRLHRLDAELLRRQQA